MNAISIKRATAAAGSAALLSATLGFTIFAPGAQALGSGDDTSVVVSTTTCLSDGADIADKLSYTFNESNASGTITLAGAAPLCHTLYVRAASWEFVDPTQKWPQRLVNFTDYPILAPGVYPFQAPARGCGQSDIYASFTLSDLTLPDMLTGPGINEPHFLSDVAGFESYPWNVDVTPCGHITTTPPVETTTAATTTPPPVETTTATTTTPPVETTTATTTTPAPTTTSASSSAPVPVVSGTTATRTTTKTTSPTAVVSGVSHTNKPTPSVNGTGQLPFTGSNTGPIALFGALGIMAGLLLLMLTRKPREQ